VIEHLEAIALSDVWNIFQEKTEEKISYMFSHRDSVCCVMFVERSSRHQDAHAKKALKTRKSSLYHFLEIFRTRVQDTY
jgi:hypothetical protein